MAAPNVALHGLSKNAIQVLLDLAKIGWGRRHDILLHTDWTGNQAEESIRRACEELVDGHYAEKHLLDGFRQGNAYSLTYSGEQLAKRLGASIIGRSRDVVPGPRWHEQVVNIMVAAAMRKEGWEFYFPREIKWSKRMAKSARESGMVAIADFVGVGIHQLDKVSDGLLVHNSGLLRPKALEAEWGEKKSDEIAVQVHSCLAAKDLGLDILTAYVYPPEMQRKLMLRRGKTDAKAIDHEGRLVRNFVARTTSMEAMSHITLMRLFVDELFRYQRHELVPLAELSARYRQAIGTAKPVGNVPSDWAPADEGQDDNGDTVSWAFRHIPTGQWFVLRIFENPNPDDDSMPASGWYFEAWLIERELEKPPKPIDHLDGYASERLHVTFEKINRSDFDKAKRAGKIWFSNRHAQRLATKAR